MTSINHYYNDLNTEKFNKLTDEDKKAYNAKINSATARVTAARVISAATSAIAAVIIGIALAILFIPALVPALAFVGTAGAIGILASGVVVLVGGLATGLLMVALSKKALREANEILHDRQPPATEPAPEPEPAPAVKPEYISDDDWTKCPEELKTLIAANTITLDADRKEEQPLFVLALHLLIEIKSKKDLSEESGDPLGATTTTSVELSDKNAFIERLKAAYKKLNEEEKSVFNIISENQYV